MIKFLFSLLFCVSVFSEKSNNINSVQEVLNFETTAINNAKNTADLIEAYLSRGESYLLLGNFKDALKDYSCAFEKLPSDYKDLTTRFRNLFGLAVCLFEEGFDEQGAYCFNEMQDILTKTSCKDCHEHQPCPDQLKILTNLNVMPSHHLRNALNTYSPA